jgi:hypothetical protein
VTGFLDFTLGDPGTDWRIIVGGVDVSEIVTDGTQPEWSLFQLNSPAPIIQIGSINLEIAELSSVNINLRSIQPDTLVQGFWRGNLLWSARVLQNEITAWDRFGDNVQAVTLRLTDRLGQALASNSMMSPIFIPSGFILPWYDYAAALIRTRGNFNVNVSGLESLMGSGENDGYFFPQDSGDNPVLFAAGVAACRGFALWCDRNEVVQFLRYPDIPSPTVRYARDQIDGLDPDFAVEPPASEVTVSGSFTSRKSTPREKVRRIVDRESGPVPGRTQQVEIRRITTTINPYDKLRRQQVTTRTVIARDFALPGAMRTSTPNFAWRPSELNITTTQFVRPNRLGAGLLESITTRKSISRRSLLPEGDDAFVNLPNDSERWEYARGDVPSRHIIEKSEGVADQETRKKIVGYIAEQVVETFRLNNNKQAEMSRTVYRTGLDRDGFLNTTLRIVESKTEPIDELPSPPAMPITEELETIPFVARAQIEGGTGQSVDVTVPGVTPASARQFCNFYALTEGRRRNPINITRPLRINESIQPLNREDVHNKALIRDGIAIQYNPSEGSAGLSYSGWLAGTFSPAIQRPIRRPPSGNLTGALAIQNLDPFVTVQGFAIPPIRLDAVGGTAPYVFTAPSLPAGLSINGAFITGTPSESFAGLVTVTVTDAASATSFFQWDLTVSATLPTLIPTVQLVLSNEYVLRNFAVIGALEAKEREQRYVLRSFAVIGPLLQVWQEQRYVLKTFGRVVENAQRYILRTSGFQEFTSTFEVYFTVIGGGGSGGGGKVGGGGGGGEYNESGIPVNLSPGSYTVIIGAGGAPTTIDGVDGSPSSFGAIATAAGGGGGGSFPEGVGRNGASGGGGANNAAGGIGSSGTNGGAGGSGTDDADLAAGGGGGSDTAGSNGTNTGTGGAGGRGLQSSFGGLVSFFQAWGSGGGGGGGTAGGQTGEFNQFDDFSGFGEGGVGGSPSIPPTPGEINTGGGGGGGEDIVNGTAFGAAGGSGVVFIWYNSLTPLATGGNISTEGSVTYHQFTTSGTFTILEPE